MSDLEVISLLTNSRRLFYSAAKEASEGEWLFIINSPRVRICIRMVQLRVSGQVPDIIIPRSPAVPTLFLRQLTTIRLDLSSEPAESRYPGRNGVESQICIHGTRKKTQWFQETETGRCKTNRPCLLLLEAM